MSSQIFGSFEEADNDLLALRYVGGEMSIAERAEFEELLAESQPARDAIAGAVQLFAAVPLAFNDSASEASMAASESTEIAAARLAMPQRTVRLPQSSRSRSRQFWRGATWAAVGAAACLLAMIGVNSMPHSGDSDKAGPDRQNELVGANAAAGQTYGELALQWTNLAPQADSLALESAAERSDLLLGSDQSSATDSDEAILDSDGTTEELSAPSWLLAAVSPPGTPLLTSPDSQDSPATE